MSLELPLVPKVGEVFLAVELTALKTMSIAEALQVLQDNGYEPQLRYRQLPSGEVSVFALLKHEKVSPEVLMNSDYLGDELDALAEIIEPDTITSPRGLFPAKTAVAA